MELTPAPEWQIVKWFNTQKDLTLAQLRGRVVVLYAFQMLCPGCVTHGIPQAQRLAKVFKDDPVVIIGLHTVFEHHEVMGPEALRVFLHEYHVQFPVGIDAPGVGGDPIPRTMRAYAMRGTPTTILIDAQGNLRQQVFGVHDELKLGAEIGKLLAEVRTASEDLASPSRSGRLRGRAKDAVLALE